MDSVLRTFLPYTCKPRTISAKDSVSLTTSVLAICEAVDTPPWCPACNVALRSAGHERSVGRCDTALKLPVGMITQVTDVLSQIGIRLITH